MTIKIANKSGFQVASVEYSESVRPAGEYRPAPWLPVKYYDNRAEDFVVVVSGRPVTPAAPIDGAHVTDLVPAEFAVAVRAGTTPTVVSAYTQLDVDAGVIDVTTGSAVTAPKNITAGDLGISAGALVDLSGSYPVGVASYSYWISAQRFDNWKKQGRSAFTADYVIAVPVLAGAAGTTTYTGWVVAANAHGIATLNASAPTQVTVNGVLDSGAAVTGTTVTLSTIPVAADVIVLTYVDSATAATPLLTGMPIYSAAGVTSLATRPVVGSYVEVNTSGQFSQWTPAGAYEDVIGQVIGFVDGFPRGLLDKVLTYYNPSTLANTYNSISPAMMATAGTATGGLPDNVYRALGNAFSGVVLINVLK